MYLESFKDVRRFIHLCQMAKEYFNKRIILLRSGFSSTGSKATTSHTGALAENSALIKATIKQSHIIQAQDFWELFQLSKTLTFLYETGVTSFSQRTFAISTISGAAGAIMSDWGDKYGLSVPKLDEKSWDALADLFPPWMPPNKFALIDYWPAVEHHRGNYEKVAIESAKIALNSPRIQALCLTVYYNATSWTVDWKKLKDVVAESHKPIFVWLFGRYSEILDAEHIFQEIQIPVFNSEEEMVRILSKILP
jgi:acetyltransferase